MHIGKKSSSDSEKYPTDSFMGRLRERKIIATLAAFAGSGVVIIEVAHHILVNHYHFPHQTVDICIVTLAGALLGTLIWRWFRGAEKRPGNVKVEVLVVPLIILLTLVIDLKFIFVMTDVSINMLLIGIVALCLGIAWIVFKSLQWAASAPELEKEVEVLKQVEEKPIRFPEWKKSIVVLPFDNISPEEAQDYFCDGMTEEIITDLSSIHELRVISRSSAMMLKGSKNEVRDIAKELNVQYVLEGSVRKAENDIRITAQLIDATSDAHLWAEKYSGTLDDVFDMQEKVSRSIVNALKLKLTSEEEQKMMERPVENVQAYECYLRARQEMWRYTEDSFDRALQYLQNGLEIVGDNSLLYAGMGLVYCNFYEFGIGVSEETLAKAEEYALKVLRLEPNSSLSYSLLGRIERFRGSGIKALKHFKKALDIDPFEQEAQFWLGIEYIWKVGKPDSARPIIEKLIDRDPLSPLNHLAKGIYYWLTGEFDNALKSFNNMLKLEPDHVLANFWSAYTLLWSKQYSKAYALIDRMAQEESPDQPQKVFTGWLLFLKYALNGEKSKALEFLTEDVRNYFWQDAELPWLGAGGFALIDEKKEAIRWLEHSINKGFINYPVLSEIDPFLENIRGEPRFKKLMERVKHEWENFEV